MDVNAVRVEIYRSFVERGVAPTTRALANQFDASEDEVRATLESLDADDIIALDPETREIWLAHPFSARTEPFHVTAGDQRWDSICIWDALGILAIVGSDGVVTTSCPDCGEALTVTIDGGRIAPSDHVVHFGVPARRWYDDIAFT
jgi:Alkylmercury lyase